MSPLAWLLYGLIRAYRVAVSPMLGRHCRFLPSCSEYALMAVEEWGALRGGWLAVRRILRCHPFHAGGLDLPPQRHPGARAEHRVHTPVGGSSR